MEYTKKDFGIELKEQILKGNDCYRISKWAFEIYINKGLTIENDLDPIILQLVVMEEGPEFEYTNQELSLLADLLINEVPDPLKRIQNLNSKESD
jgi:hypothetical protein